MKRFAINSRKLLFEKKIFDDVEMDLSAKGLLPSIIVGVNEYGLKSPFTVDELKEYIKVEIPRPTFDSLLEHGYIKEV